MNIGLLPTRHARYRPDHLAVVFEDTRLTYRQFNKRINRIGNALRARTGCRDSAYGFRFDYGDYESHDDRSRQRSAPESADYRT